MTKGIEFKFHVAFEKVDKQPDGSLLVHMTGHEPIPADMLLFATGRRPHTENLGLETADVALDAKGAIKVDDDNRSEEHTSELQSLMRISYAVFCLKKNTNNKQ